MSLSAQSRRLGCSGGLAEVAGSLPLALAEHWRVEERSLEVEVLCISPLYPRVWREIARRGVSLEPNTQVSLAPLSDRSAQVWSLNSSSNDVTEKVSLSHVFIDIPWAFDREHLYGPPGEAYTDNPIRYASYCLAALRWLDEVEREENSREVTVKTVVHCHDWQASFFSIYQRLGWAPRAKTIFTIHNLMHQGL